MDILFEFLKTLRSLFEGLDVLAECKAGIGFTYTGVLFTVELCIPIRSCITRKRHLNTDLTDGDGGDADFQSDEPASP